ncbi:MAG: ABC transporter permease [Thermoproteota archaeon]
MISRKSGLFKRLSYIFKVFGRKPTAMAGLIIVVFFTLMALIGPFFFPLDIRAYPAKRYLPPSWEHPLGTDPYGRDVLMQIINGSRDALLIAALTGLVTIFIATVVGVSSGIIGGLFDEVLMRITETFLLLPQYPLLLLIAAILPAGRELTLFEVSLIIGIVQWPATARAIRSQVLAIREKPFIEAARCLNLGNLHVIFREIIPNLMPYLVMNFFLALTGGIYSQVILFSLGILRFTSVNWGVMINIAMGESALINPKAWIYLFSPIACIVLLQTGLVLISSALEEVFNPRLRTEE